MARKLVPLDEAAKQLGVSSDELNEMRQRQEIYGYRDGATWKFKPEDLEKLQADRAAASGSSVLADGPVPGPPSQPTSDDDSDSGEDMVLLSEFELGGSGPSTSSTVIGKPGAGMGAEDSDIRVSTGSDLNMAAGVDQPKPPAKPKGTGSSGKLPKPKPKSGSSTKITGGEQDSGLDLGDDIPLDLGSGSIDLLSDEPSSQGSGSMSSGSDLALGSSASFQADDSMPAEEDNEESTLNLGAPDGSEDVLAAGGTGSDITISPADSGISLIDPADSGLSLEEPLELSAADDSSFDLSTDGSSSSVSGVGEDSDFDSEAVMELRGDDEFLLTPLEESSDEESQDSGSQVIALDSESDFEPTGIGEAPAALLEADDAGEGLVGLSPAVSGATAATAPMMFAPVREAQYSTLVVLSLAGCVVVLGLSGTMMYDLMRNMWSWDSPYPSSSFLMDNVLSLFGS